MSHSSARRRVVLVAGVLAGALVAGCSGGEEPAPAAPTPSTVGELDAEGTEVPRLDFCALVPDEAVAAALDDEPTDAARRGPGEPDAADDPAAGAAPLQEVGCTWTAGGASAAAWVFAEPVDAEQAGRLVEAASTRQGCEVAEAAYGAPGVRQQCVGQTSDSPRVRYAGLLGDTWLTCELSGPDAPARAEAWCVALLTSLDPQA